MHPNSIGEEIQNTRLVSCFQCYHYSRFRKPQMLRNGYSRSKQHDPCNLSDSRLTSSFFLTNSRPSILHEMSKHCGNPTWRPLSRIGFYSVESRHIPAFFRRGMRTTHHYWAVRIEAFQHWHWNSNTRRPTLGVKVSADRWVYP